MVYKGCVIKVEEDYAIVMTNTMEYFRVIKKDGLEVGKPILFVHEDLYQEKQRNLKQAKMLVAIFIVMILSLSMLIKWNAMLGISHAAAVVSLDINPSMEFEINTKNQVLKVIPINQAGRELIDRNMKGMGLQEALWLVIHKAKEKQYITSQKNSILLSAVVIREDYQLDTAALEETLETKWVQDYPTEPLKVFYVEGNEEDLKVARKQHISVGKYEAYKQSAMSDQEIPVEKLKIMKVQDLIKAGILKEKEEKAKENRQLKESNPKIHDLQKKEKDKKKEEKKSSHHESAQSQNKKEVFSEIKKKPTENKEKKEKPEEEEKEEKKEIQKDKTKKGGSEAQNAELKKEEPQKEENPPMINNGHAKHSEKSIDDGRNEKEKDDDKEKNHEEERGKDTKKSKKSDKRKEEGSNKKGKG